MARGDWQAIAFLLNMVAAHVWFAMKARTSDRWQYWWLIWTHDYRGLDRWHREHRTEGADGG